MYTRHGDSVLVVTSQCVIVCHRATMGYALAFEPINYRGRTQSGGSICVIQSLYCGHTVIMEGDPFLAVSNLSGDKETPSLNAMSSMQSLRVVSIQRVTSIQKASTIQL